MVHEFKHESVCHTRQLCGFSTDNLAMSFIQCRNVVSLLNSMGHIWGTANETVPP